MHLGTNMDNWLPLSLAPSQPTIHNHHPFFDYDLLDGLLSSATSSILIGATMNSWIVSSWQRWDLQSEPSRCVDCSQRNMIRPLPPTTFSCASSPLSNATSGSHIPFVYVTIDPWSELQDKKMEAGGNKLNAFLSQYSNIAAFYISSTFIRSLVVIA